MQSDVIMYSDMVMALISNAVDREEKVTDSIVESLRKIGSKQSDLVVSSCLEYINKKKACYDDIMIVMRFRL